MPDARCWPTEDVPGWQRLSEEQRALLAVPITECPMCRFRWDEDDGARCDHEAGWYRDWIATLVGMLTEQDNPLVGQQEER